MPSLHDIAVASVAQYHPLVDALDRLASQGLAPYQRRLVDFMGCRPRLVEVNECYAATAERLVTEVLAAPPSPADGLVRLWPLLNAEGFSLLEAPNPSGGHPAPPHLLVRRECDGALVAGFIDGELYVDPALRGRGIGVELMLTRAVRHDGGQREGFLYRKAGIAAARAAHRLAVLVALAQSRALAPTVLADHPGVADPDGSPSP